MPRRGERHHNAKLTDAKVLAMREEYATGKTSHWKLAMKYDIESADTIGRIIRRETWTHI